ncbi:CBS domain-containing protein [Geotalea uraniireducens]|uniref:CBS domain containing protein n=1 Tax=Geotalea uraniireducens (strain Rf4) TaxID=351605 RepID=A5G3Y1_GEOUR|nr:CBS domain-containing protein [Geotalea uraniireducens]ABQ26499.1 CBS domain containing protein [Geotalea uraniireducens Rf4]
MLTAADVMTKDVITVKTGTTVRELAELFTANRMSSFPVVDDNGELIGIVTETDLIEQDKSLHIPTVISLFDWVIYLESEKKFEKELKKMTGQTVGDIYTEDVESVKSTSLLSEVADIMSSKKIHAVPVVDDKKLVGVISRIDLIRTMINP